LPGYLVDPGQAYQSPEGRFKLGDLVVGLPLQVTVSAKGYEKAVVERVVAARPDDARIEEFRIVPLDPASLQTYAGRLIDAKGQAVAGAQVRLIAAKPRDPNRRGDRSTRRPEGFPFFWP